MTNAPTGRGRAFAPNWLTERQLEAVTLLAMGYSYEQIAFILALAPGYVRNIMGDACERTSTSGPTHLVAIAMRMSFITDIDFDRMEVAVVHARTRPLPIGWTEPIDLRIGAYPIKLHTARRTEAQRQTYREATSRRA